MGKKEKKVEKAAAASYDMSVGTSTGYTVPPWTLTSTSYSIPLNPTVTQSHTIAPPPHIPDACGLLGHMVEKWAEYLDGECVGTCSQCMMRIRSSRMPGGMPFMRLKALLELLIATPEDAALFLEINDITDLLEREQESLDEARALLATARKMAQCSES